VVVEDGSRPALQAPRDPSRLTGLGIERHHFPLAERELPPKRIFGEEEAPIR